MLNAENSLHKKRYLRFQILIYNAHKKLCFRLPVGCQHYINETFKNGGLSLKDLARNRAFIEPAKMFFHLSKIDG